MHFLCHKILVLYSTCALTPSVQTSEIGYQQQRMALWNSGSAVLVDHKLAIMHHFGQIPFSPGLYMLKQPVVSISGTTYLTKIDTQLLWGSLFQLCAMFRRYTNSANMVQFCSVLRWRIEQIILHQYTISPVLSTTQWSYKLSNLCFNVSLWNYWS